MSSTASDEPAPAATPTPRGGRTQVQWVELYTRGTLYVLLWVFQAGLLGPLVTEAGPGNARALVAVTVVAFLLTLAATPVVAAAVRTYPTGGPTPWRHLLPLLAGSVLALAAAPLLPEDLRGAVMLAWVPLVWSVSALRSRAWAVVVLVWAAGVPALLGGVTPVVVGALGGLFVLFTVRVSLWMEDVVRELDRARGTRAALAVAEERLRFSRDVHDVLGRRLATIAVTSELAAALAARGDDRAAAQMLEVRGVAHEALREARELARGYRAADLATELDGAASLLRSAGITLRADTDGLPPQWQEAAGWVVREAVTNVLRHSSAASVEIGWDGVDLVVRNDGADAGTPRLPQDDRGTGTGLVGLRERLRPLGAELDAGPDGDDFVVRATLGSPVRTREGAR